MNEKIEIPGYSHVEWAHVAVGQEVWLQGRAEGLPEAYGPYTVESTARRLLKNAKMNVFMHYAEDLIKPVPVMVETYISNPLDSGEILKARKILEEEYGAVYNGTELKEAFEVIQFAAPYVVVIDKKTQKKGTLEFTHLPRFYFGFVED